MSMKSVSLFTTYCFHINDYSHSQLLFQLTIRSLSCAEISDQPALVARLKKTLDVGTTPAIVLVPWLPTPAMIKKIWATNDIYKIVIKAIKNRDDSGLFRGDTLLMLLDTGDEQLVVVGVCVFFSDVSELVPNLQL